MSRRILVMLAAAVFAVAGSGAALQLGAASGLLVVAVIASAITVAAIAMLAHSAAATHPIHAQIARDAWLQATIGQSPAHADARALMRPRPPSVLR